MKIFNQTQNNLVADKAQMADTAISRLVGLLKHSAIFAGEALIITQCRSIHMFFMKFGIDVIFIDRNSRVVGLVKKIQPFGLSPYFWRATSAIELPEGVIDQTGTKVGDQIRFED